MTSKLRYSSNHYDSHNRNGAKLCEAVGCRRYKRLVIINRGVFCSRHAIDLQLIRQRIQHGPYETEDSYRARLEEAMFRKVMHEGHMQHLYRLEQSLFSS